MKKIYILVTIMIPAYFLLGQTTSCEDPNAFAMNTVCGTQFDLCIDRYVMDENTTMELQVFTNDMNMFDPCQSFICSPCAHGTLVKLPNCNYAYSPDEGFYGNDTFYYSMIINDICTNTSYCEEDDGKIWTVFSRYSGPDGLNLVVNSKFGNNIEFVGALSNMQNGDYFLMDGAHLNTSQANWTYTFSYPEGHNGCQGDDCIYEEVIVHTSCSEQIIGVDYGLFRVISGCIAAPQDKAECANQSRSQAYTTTSQWIDTTMVVITVFEPLPIELEDFRVNHENGINILKWSILSAVNEQYIEVEKSTNGKDFYRIGSISPIVEKRYTFEDPESQTSKISYYRLKIISFDHNVKYSRVVHITNKWSHLINIFPNPTDNLLYISYNGDQELTYSYEILDMAGNLMVKDRSQENKSTVVHLGQNEMKSGMYLIRIQFEKGGVYLEKFIYTSE